MDKLLKFCKSNLIQTPSVSRQLGGTPFVKKLFFSTQVTPSVKPTQTATSTDLLSQILEETNEATKETKGDKKVGGPRVRQPDEAWCLVRKIPYSTYKMSPVVNKLRGLPYQEAFAQLSMAAQRFAKDYVLKALQSCRYNAEVNHNLDPEKLVVHACWLGKDQNVKDVRMHARGRRAMMIHPFSRLNLILKQVDDPLAYYRQKTMKRSEKRRVNKLRRLAAAKESKSADSNTPQQ